MGVKFKFEVECDRCKKTENVDEQNRSQYGTYPSGWGEVEFSSRRKEVIFCSECIVDFQEWWKK